MQADPHDTAEHKRLLEDFLSAQMEWDDVRPDPQFDRDSEPATMSAAQRTAWDTYQTARARLNDYRTTHSLEAL